MKEGQNFNFRLSGLYLKYLHQIITDIQITSPTKLMKHIISEYMDFKYGADDKLKLRREYLDSICED